MATDSAETPDVSQTPDAVESQAPELDAPVPDAPESASVEQAAPPASPADVEAQLLERLIGRRVLALDTTARDRYWAWLGPLLVGALAALARFVALGRPHALVFDETYYVKNAYTLLQVGFDAAWPDGANDMFLAGNTDVFEATAEYTVHPPLGKWLIALGIWLGGVDNSWSWRLSTAVVGTLAVVILARTARRIFGSTALGVLAGGLLAIDGLAIVMSRTGLLDNFLMFFTLVAFAALVVDREQHRRRLAAWAAPFIAAGKPVPTWEKVPGVRWWRAVAWVSLGAACSVKWSGLYVLAAFGLLTVAWDWGARRAVAGRGSFAAWFTRDAAPAGLVAVGTALAVYLASWWAWFTHPQSWNRGWATTHPATYPSWFPDWLASASDTLRSFADYHVAMYRFHVGLDSTHSYMSNPWGWPLQLRPTSFYWQDVDPSVCGGERCVEAVTSLGNPLLWWLASAALVFIAGAVIWQAVARVRKRWLAARGRLPLNFDALAEPVPGSDWRGIAILVGVAAGWVPWLYYSHRTIFTFYSIVFTPFMVLALVYAAAIVLETLQADGAAERTMARTRTVIGSVVALIAAVSIWFYPIWTAMPVRYSFWLAHMWLGSTWI